MSFIAGGGGGSSSVSSSTDVALDNVVDAQALVYNESVGKWRNAGITKTSVGLGSVDNTSDANKPISAATQTALNGKAATSHTHTRADVTDIGLKVVAQATAPADTSVIWVKTS